MPSAGVSAMLLLLPRAPPSSSQASHWTSSSGTIPYRSTSIDARELRREGPVGALFFGPDFGLARFALGFGGAENWSSPRLLIIALFCWIFASRASSYALRGMSAAVRREKYAYSHLPRKRVSCSLRA